MDETWSIVKLALRKHKAIFSFFWGHKFYQYTQNKTQKFEYNTKQAENYTYVFVVESYIWRFLNIIYIQFKTKQINKTNLDMQNIILHGHVASKLLVLRSKI